MITQEQELLVAQAEEARRLALDSKNLIWDDAVARCVAKGLSEHQPRFWDEVETEAGEPYRKADAAVTAAYTEEVKKLLPAVRAARKAREQAQAYSLYGRGYDTDGGSGYGANASD